jgi:antitoxin component YwqK of YwqJK toxin-antitoxin module
VDGLRQGEWKYYYESGGLEYTVSFVDDLKQGEYYWYWGVRGIRRYRILYRWS